MADLQEIILKTLHDKETDVDFEYLFKTQKEDKLIKALGDLCRNGLIEQVVKLTIGDDNYSINLSIEDRHIYTITDKGKRYYKSYFLRIQPQSLIMASYMAMTNKPYKNSWVKFIVTNIWNFLFGILISLSATYIIWHYGLFTVN